MRVLSIALIADEKANDEADYDTGNAYDKRQTGNQFLMFRE
jgi:hypothetical protein